MPANPTQLSVKTLKYISAINLRIAPVSSTPSTRSLRLLLGAIPKRPPTGSGLTNVPETSLSTVDSIRDQLVKVTYSDKKVVDLDPANMSIVDLIRQIEEPAKVLRNKAEGI